MKFRALLLTILISTSCFAQTDLSWYKMLRGMIGNYAVTMHLHKAGHEYHGFYYYDNYQNLLSFSGEDTSAKGKIALYTSEELFSFTIKNGKAGGTWTKTKGKSESFIAEEAKPPMGFTYVFSKGGAKLRPKWKDSPDITISQASIWPTGKSPSDEFVKKIIRDYYRDSSSKEDIGVIFLKAKKKMVSDYLNDFKSDSDKQIKESLFAYSQEVQDELMVCYQWGKLISLAASYYAYTGGAHGNYGTTYIAIDLRVNKKLEVGDVLTKEGIKALGSLLEKNFRKQYEVKPSETLGDAGLFEDKIAPNDNFFVTGRGIGFAFNPYEIGPYSMGEIDIYIPFSDIKKYLKPDFKTLIDYKE